MEKSKDKCYFCSTLSQFNFMMQHPVCSYHWDMMYHQKVPKYIPDEQILNYKKISLVKKLKGFI